MKKLLRNILDLENVGWSIPAQDYSVYKHYVDLRQKDVFVGKQLFNILREENFSLEKLKEMSETAEEALGNLAKKYMGSTIPRLLASVEGGCDLVYLPLEEQAYKIQSLINSHFQNTMLFFGRQCPSNSSKQYYEASILAEGPVSGGTMTVDEAVKYATDENYRIAHSIASQQLKHCTAVIEDRTFYDTINNKSIDLKLDFPFQQRPDVKVNKYRTYPRIQTDVNIFPRPIKEKMFELTSKGIDESTILWVGRGISYHILGRSWSGYFNSMAFMTIDNGNQRKGILILDIETPQTDVRDRFPYL